jgi:predicted transcriptional regulator
MKRVRLTIVADEEKQCVLYVLCESVCAYVCVALVIQNATCMSRIILSSVASPTLPYFSILSRKRHDFREKVTEHKICVLIFSTTFVWYVSHLKKNSARYYHKCTFVFTGSARYPCRILLKLEISRHIFEKKYSNIKFHKNTSSGSRIVQYGRKSQS